MNELISVEQAKEWVLRQELKPIVQERSLDETLGMVLASTVEVPADIPAYPQSAMDGYAIRFADMQDKMKLEWEMAAGESNSLQLKEGTAMRIFTGAPLPRGADTVIIQEKIRIEHEGYIVIEDRPEAAGQNVRPVGSEARAGEEAVPAGTLLSPAVIGFLAGLGISKIPVYEPPDVALILTGNELIAPGSAMEFGKVYDSNSYTLRAALEEMNIRNLSVHYVGDQLEDLVKVLRQALDEAQYVLLTGGVSVGDYDFVVEASAACGIQTIFHGVRQKPGKPLFFGSKDDTLIFGLPGNPSSVLSCFLNYVYPSLLRFMRLPYQLNLVSARLTNAYRKSAEIGHFVKGYYDSVRGSVQVLTGQESYRMRSFAFSNCLICLPEHVLECHVGNEVDILLLPWKNGGLA